MDFVILFSSQGNNLVIINALWPQEYQVMIGDGICHEIKLENTEITCLPPETEPVDKMADNARVRVSIILD